MKHFILKLFSAKDLWKEILNREGFSEPERAIETSSLWSEVFHKSPLLSEFLKKREIDLLKRSTLRDVSSEFILGQIAENRLWQSFDRPLNVPVRNEPIEKEKEIDKEKFIQKWNK
jgi:hypothetical protein